MTERKMIKINNTLRKFIQIITVAVMISTVMLPFTAVAKGADRPIGTLSAEIDAVSSNGSWSWDSKALTLSLNNCKIKTKELYGCVVPDGTRVVISGDNTISSERVALWCRGTMVIEGSGTLNIKSKKDTALTTDKSLRLKGGNIYVSTKSKYSAPVVIDKSLRVNGGSMYISNHKSNSGIEVAKVIRIYKGTLVSESKADNAIEVFAGKEIYIYGGRIKGKAEGKTSYGVWSDGNIYVSGGKLRGYSNNKADDSYGIGCVAKKTFEISGGNVKAKGNLTALAAWNRVISKNNKGKSKVAPNLKISNGMEMSSKAKVRKASVSQKYHGLGAERNDYICEKFCVLGKKNFSYSYDNIRFTNTLNSVTIQQLISE